MEVKQIDRKSTFRSVVLQGLGGSGKTQLASGYCAQCEDRKTVRAIFWANASTRGSMENSCDEIWDVIRPRPTMQAVQTSDSLATKIRSVKEAMSGWSHPWLLVLDDYNDLNGFPEIMEFLPQSAYGRILITSRLHDLSRYGFGREIIVEGMDEQLAMTMFFSRSGITRKHNSSEVENDAKTIVNRLGRFPLAIDQAAAYISDNYETLSNFVTVFDSKKANVLQKLSHDLSYRKKGPHGRESQATICSTWELSFEMIQDSYPLTRIIKGFALTFLAYLDPRSISDEVFAQPFIPWNEETKQLLEKDLIHQWMTCFLRNDKILDLSEFYELIAELATLSLIQHFGRSADQKYRIFSLHPLVRDWLKIRTKRVEREQCFFMAVCLLRGCVDAYHRSSAGQQMSLSAEGEIQVLNHLEALNTEALLEMNSATTGNMFERLHPLIEEMSQGMSVLRAESIRQQMQELGKWLSVSNHREYHRYILDRAASGTGSSLLDSDKFQRWMSAGGNSILWYVGDVGTGKTFVTAVTISYLEEVFLKANPGYDAVIFFFLRDGMDSTNLLREIFGNLLKQLLALQVTEVTQDREIKEVRALYEQHIAAEVTDEVIVIHRLLSKSIEKLGGCYIVLDGLDLCPEDVLDKLLGFLEQLLTSTAHVKLLIVSRDYVPFEYTLMTLFEGAISKVTTKNSVIAEKSKYIHDRILSWNMRQDLKDRVEQIVLAQNLEKYGSIPFHQPLRFLSSSHLSNLLGKY
jgi:hypothetical protein